MTTETPFKTKALFEYKSDFEEDLTFPAGQIVEVTSIEDDEWFSGQYTDANGVTHSGLFPKNFVGEPIREEHIHIKHAPVPVPAPIPEPVQAEDEDEEEEETPTSPSFKEPVGQPLKEEIADQPPAAVESRSTIEKPPPLKGLSSRISTFNSESPAIVPGNKYVESTSKGKVFQGTSSYIPPSFKKEPTQSKRMDFSHSSYVPPSLGFSRSSTKEFNEASAPPPPVVHNEPEEEKDEGPKLSLKERIKLLQQQQAEEAERQAAALQKKQQKKENHHHQQQQAAPVVPSTEEPNQDDGEPEETDSEAPYIPSTDYSSLDPEARHQSFSESISSKASKPLEELEKSPVQEEAIENEANDNDNNEDDDDDDDDEDEEDSEESKRAALRDRMARLAGAGGMGGMGGFNPFGGFPTPAPSSKPKKSKKKETENSDLPEAAPIPIMSFGTGSAPQLPAALQRRQTVEEAKPVTEEVKEVKQAVNVDDEEEEDDFKDTVEHIEPDNVYVKDEEPVEAETPTGDVTETLADKLLKVDLANSRVLQSESAVEGDDEEEKTTSEDEFSDRPREREIEREREIKETEPISIQNPLLVNNQSAHQSDYTTGYESDDDTQVNVKSDGVVSVETSPSKLDTSNIAPVIPSIPSASVPSVPSASIPSIPSASVPSVPSASIPSIPSASVPSAPVPQVPSATVPQIPTESAPTALRSSISVPPPPVPVLQDITTPKKAPPPPPIQTSVERAASFSSPSFPTPPVPTSLPSIPSPSIPSPDAPSSIPIRRTSTLGSVRSIPPPIPQSPIDSISTPTTSKYTSTIPEAETVSSPRFSAPPPPPAHHGVVSRSSFSESIPEYGRESIGFSDEEKFDLSSGWYLRENELPSILQSRVGKDIIFEVDVNTIPRRGGKTLVLKDYYILQQDNSQIVLHVSYESHNPQATVSLTQENIPAPVLNKTQLSAYSKTFGNEVFQIATGLVNHSINQPLIPYIFSKIQGILPPVGLRSYGVVTYTNTNNLEVHQEDDFRPGDIVAINKAKFSQHKKLRQKVIVDVGNDGVPFAGILTEFDQEKRKFRVIEVENGKIKHGSYRPSDMKSGKIKVFRPVGRDYVW